MKKVKERKLTKAVCTRNINAKEVLSKKHEKNIQKYFSLILEVIGQKEINWSIVQSLRPNSLFIIFRSNRKSFDLHWKERKIWASNFPIQPPSYFLIFHLSEEKNKKICYSLFLHLTFWLPSIKVLHWVWWSSKSNSLLQKYVLLKLFPNVRQYQCFDYLLF